MKFKYIIIKAESQGTPIFDSTGFFQPVFLIIGIEGETRGCVIPDFIQPIPLDPSLSATELKDALPAAIQAWVDINYNS